MDRNNQVPERKPNERTSSANPSQIVGFRRFTGENLGQFHLRNLMEEGLQSNMNKLRESTYSFAKKEKERDTRDTCELEPNSISDGTHEVEYVRNSATGAEHFRNESMTMGPDHRNSSIIMGSDHRYSSIIMGEENGPGTSTANDMFSGDFHIPQAKYIPNSMISQISCDNRSNQPENTGSQIIVSTIKDKAEQVEELCQKFTHSCQDTLPITQILPARKLIKKISSKPVHKKSKLKKNSKAQNEAELETYKQKNDPKNTIKNFGKEIIKFVRTNQPLVFEMFRQIDSKLSFEQLEGNLVKMKKQIRIRKIEHLRDLWLSPECGRQIRAMSEFFLRKICCKWVFNSRITNRSSPLRFRHRLREAVKNPNQFKTLK